MSYRTHLFVSQVVKRCGPMVVVRKTATFSMDGLTDDLNRLADWSTGQAENCLALPELQMQVACGALNAALGYLEVSGLNLIIRVQVAAECFLLASFHNIK